MTTPEFAGNRDNFCYRHPDRQSFVLCQRCLRTDLPGVPDAGRRRRDLPRVHGGAAQEPHPRSEAGRAPLGRPEHRHRDRAQRQAGRHVRAARDHLVHRARAADPGPRRCRHRRSCCSRPGTCTRICRFMPFEPWRLLTAVFVHGGFLHLALNMLALWMLGQSLEPMLGRARFLALYLISGLGGSVAGRGARTDHRDGRCVRSDLRPDGGAPHHRTPHRCERHRNPRDPRHQLRRRLRVLGGTSPGRRTSAARSSVPSSRSSSRARAGENSGPADRAARGDRRALIVIVAFVPPFLITTVLA